MTARSDLVDETSRIDCRRLACRVFLSELLPVGDGGLVAEGRWRLVELMLFLMMSTTLSSDTLDQAQLIDAMQEPTNDSPCVVNVFQASRPGEKE
jgi:hypothetical protein